MALIERDIVVAGTPEAAFDYVANFESCAEWDPGVVSSQRRGSGPAGVGTSYDVEVDFNGRRLPMVYAVTTWDRPHRVVLVGTGSTVRGVDEITFTDGDGANTRIHYRADIRMRGLLSVITPLLRKRFEALGDAAMQGMQNAFARRSA
jgi:carbon monoxide dehydrogenase subunit G